MKKSLVGLVLGALVVSTSSISLAAEKKESFESQISKYSNAQLETAYWTQPFDEFGYCLVIGLGQLVSFLADSVPGFRAIPDSIAASEDSVSGLSALKSDLYALAIRAPRIIYTRKVNGNKPGGPNNDRYLEAFMYAKQAYKSTSEIGAILHEKYQCGNFLEQHYAILAEIRKRELPKLPVGKSIKEIQDARQPIRSVQMRAKQPATKDNRDWNSMTGAQRREWLNQQSVRLSDGRLTQEQLNSLAASIALE